MRRGWGWSWGACLTLVLAACGGPVAGEEEGVSETAPLTTVAQEEAPRSEVAPAAAAQGRTRWLQSLGGVGKEHAAGLAHDSVGNVSLAVNIDDAVEDGVGALAAYAPGTFVVVKYGTDGARLWSLHLPGFAESLTVDSRSNVLVAGRNPAGADYGGGALPAGRFLLKLDRDGDFVWARSLESLGVPSAFELQRLDTDRFGNVALVGTLPDARLRNVVGLLKLGPDGDFLWLHADGREGFATSVAADSEGHFYLTGWHREQQPGEVDALPFLMKLDGAGNVLWTRTLDSEYGVGTGVAVHGNRVVVSGWFIKPLTFLGRTYHARGSWSDAFVAAFDREGTERWVRVLGFTGLDVSMDYEDGVVLLGRYEDGDDLGTGPMAGVPGVQSNLFITKLDRVDGALRWVRGFPMAQPRHVDVSMDRFFVSSHAATGACSVTGGRTAQADFGMGMMPPPVGGWRDLLLGGFDP
ncbi:hypothetical protein ACLESO_40835 [Pyxidicoccus sp. 3LG]